VTFQTGIEIDEEVSLLGTCNCYYHELVSVFGLPNTVHDLGSPSATTNWTISFHDGSIAEIYDYRVAQRQYSRYPWHVNGNNYIVLQHITELMTS
jgi:hypothetical protein